MKILGIIILFGFATLAYGQNQPGVGPGALMIGFSTSTFAQTTPVGQEIEVLPKEKTPVSPVESSSRKVDKKLNKSKKRCEKYDNTPDTGVGGGSETAIA